MTNGAQNYDDDVPNEHDLPEQDFSEELIAPGTPSPVREVSGRARSIPEQRESMRGVLAGGLTLLFAILVLGSGIAVWTGVDVEVVRSLLEIVLPAVIALAGSAIGFYFGGERPDRSPE